MSMQSVELYRGPKSLSYTEQKTQFNSLGQSKVSADKSMVIFLKKGKLIELVLFKT